MIYLVFLTFPALFSVFALERFTAKKFNLHNFFFIFVTNTVLTNFFSFLLIYWLTEYRTVILIENGGFKVSHCFGYLLVAICVSVAITLGEAYYHKTLRINMKDIENVDKNSNDEKNV